MLRGWQHNQHGGPMTVVASPSSTEDAFAVRPQDLETTVSTSADPGGLTHLPDPQLGWRPPLGWAEKVLSQGWPKEVRRSTLILSRLHDDAYCSGTATNSDNKTHPEMQSLCGKSGFCGPLPPPMHCNGRSPKG